MNTLVDVLVEDDDNGEEDTQLAKIVGETEKTYHLKFLTLRKSGLYKYDTDPIEIDKECISGFYDSVDERDAGFCRIEGGYQPVDDYDDDYEPSESGSDTESEDESLYDSEEENIDQ